MKKKDVMLLAAAGIAVAGTVVSIVNRNNCKSNRKKSDYLDEDDFDDDLFDEEDFDDDLFDEEDFDDDLFDEEDFDDDLFDKSQRFPGSDEAENGAVSNEPNESEEVDLRYEISDFRTNDLLHFKDNDTGEIVKIHLKLTKDCRWIVRNIENAAILSPADVITHIVGVDDEKALKLIKIEHDVECNYHTLDIVDAFNGDTYTICSPGAMIFYRDPTGDKEFDDIIKITCVEEAGEERWCATNTEFEQVSIEDIVTGLTSRAGIPLQMVNISYDKYEEENDAE